jgi:hypothetical protein
MYAPPLVGSGKVPDNNDYAEQEQGAAVKSINMVKEFKPGNIKVSAPVPGNKTEITGHIPGIDQYQDACAKGNAVEDHIPGQIVNRFAGIIEAEQGNECPQEGAGAKLYPVSNKGRFQGWGNLFQKTAKGIQANCQGSIAEVLHAGLAPIVNDKNQDNYTDYQVNAGYNL